MSAMTILQNYPKHETDIQSLADTARKIQSGSIKLEFDKELYSQLASKKVRVLVKAAQKMFKDVDQSSLPSWKDDRRHDDDDDDDDHTVTRKLTYEELININQPGIRVPGYSDLSLTDKVRIQHILKIFKYAMPVQGPIRMGYLVKRGGGKQGLFSRKTLKLRWFVIENEKLSYYKVCFCFCFVFFCCCWHIIEQQKKYI
ncbi:hypothetical protein RFI_24332 [Reticulomyxa filosa]|uniref:PH domain-containing protein n=1 Tax=Reticulomyxa filosa TaxID=46433 RepID=X6MG93_RETFI|nr:hypothetical protein RFI_24332 [Reticulomyxa filosa]|eukprot:ETO13043.1 hypothetical protein RFI_24332 [Reticulomyxa filosa]